MAKSGLRYLGVSIVMMGIGVACAYLVDQTHGTVAEVLIGATLLLCLGGAGLFLLGLFKVAVGLFSRPETGDAESPAPAATGDRKP